MEMLLGAYAGVAGTVKSDLENILDVNINQLIIATGY